MIPTDGPHHERQLEQLLVRLGLGVAPVADIEPSGKVARCSTACVGLGQHSRGGSNARMRGAAGLAGGAEALDDRDRRVLSFGRRRVPPYGQACGGRDGIGGRGTAALEHESGAIEQRERSEHEKAAVHGDGSPVEGVDRVRYARTSSTVMAAKHASESIGNGTPATACEARSVQDGPLWLHGMIGAVTTPV